MLRDWRRKREYGRAQIVLLAVLLIFVLKCFFNRQGFVVFVTREVKQQLYDMFFPIAQEHQGIRGIVYASSLELFPLLWEEPWVPDELQSVAVQEGIQGEEPQEPVSWVLVAMENNAYHEKRIKEQESLEALEQPALVEEKQEDYKEDASQPQEEAYKEKPRYQQVQELMPKDYTAYADFIKAFYTIDENTMAGRETLSIEKFMAMDFSMDPAEGPEILIYHTHSQETFSDSNIEDPSTTIVGVGDYLEELLENTYGYEVLHHKAVYDKETRDDAYGRALKDIEALLEEYPTIQVVIDLHRDQMPEGTRLVTTVNGKKTARFMFFNGLSRTKKTGNLEYLYNPYLQENLGFSFQLHKKAVEYFPDLMRKIYLKGYRYNMHLRPRALLIELGAQNNTLEEAMNACEPLAFILDLVLQGEE